MSAAEMPDWVPSDYDPDAPLLDRLRVMVEIEGGIELHVLGDRGVIENVGQPVDWHENHRVFHVKCGAAIDDWDWEINIPKKEGVPATLDRVDPDQTLEAYENTKRHWLRIEDVRIWAVDVDRIEDADK